jgi:hypothetical protein
MNLRRLIVSALLLSALAAVASAQDPLDLLDGKKPTKPAAKGDDFDALLNGTAKGTPFRLVMASDPSRGLDEVLYWRTLPGTVAAQTAPFEFRLGGTSVIAPVIAKSDEGEGPAVDTYPTSGEAKLESGENLLKPGDIPIHVRGGVPSSKHPAIRVVETKVGQEVRILCAPVRLEAVDARGVPVPQNIQVTWQGKSLLRQAAAFNPLVIWLPIGVSYDSTFGPFSLSATGKVEANTSRLAADVTLTDVGLRKRLPAATAKAVNQPSPVLQITAKPIAAQTASPKEPPKFAAYLDPLVSPGAPGWLAISKTQYEFATAQKLIAEHVSAHVVFSEKPLILRVDSPPDEVRARAAAVTNGELVWFAVTLPADHAGPLAIRLEGKFFSPAQAVTLVADRGTGWQLVSHRWRTVWAETETATYQLLLARGTKPATARIMAQSTASDAKPLTLGTVTMPAVETTDFDSRLFTVDLRDLPTGDYTIWAEADEQRSGKVPLKIVPWQRKSPFLVHSMSGCTTCWPTTDEGLATLRDAGLEMATATGASSLLDTHMPELDPQLAAQLQAASLNLPSEVTLRPTANDDLLSRMLRHELRLIDLTVVRANGLYNEGLSYHHSYTPSVERMVRRMQIFTQQTADYPSFWGVNYSWFPAMYGYVEGGVPTDAHTADRNRVLAENLKAAGHEPLSRDEIKWLHEHRADREPQAQKRGVELCERGTRYWKAANEFGWGKHNRLYNDAIRQVRPDIVATLFENAGHDENKRTRDLFGDMNAVCYESYTDYGDWPMSSAFAVDWASGNTAGKPVWLTTCWGTTPDGMMKSFFHAFARGLAGGGVPLQATNALSEIARRGMGLRFAGQYGALATHATPDRRVAILSRAAKLALVPRGMWEYHAAYYHLTRLGYPPALVADDEVATSGVPEHVQVLLLVAEQLPLEPATRAALEKFTARGGKIITLGPASVEVPGAIVVDQPLKHLWEMSGFKPESHQDLWREFEQAWRQPLAAAMRQAGLVPLATTDANRGIALTMDAGAVRYVVVIADTKGKHSNDFEPTAGLPVSLEGTGWIVRDLVKQQTLDATTESSRTKVNVDLLTEPTTLLALYRMPPAKVVPQLSDSPRLGSSSVFKATVLANDGVSDLGPVPVRYSLVGPDRKERAFWNNAAGETIWCRLPRLDSTGNWQFVAQELLTGVSTAATVEVVPADGDSKCIQAIDVVHFLDREQIRKFTNRKTEKLVILEPEQSHLAPLANQLVKELYPYGVNARVWQLRPEDFDTVPQRWYPRSEDESRLEQVAKGELVGYRGAMKPYIDKLKRTHVPTLGGYDDVAPRYMVGKDCIVFSGGRLAESLRAVTPWMATPHVPGRGQGRLVVCFSPFAADRQVLAVVANDDEGIARSASALSNFVKKEFEAILSDVVSDGALALVPGKNEMLAHVKESVSPVATPYVGYQPIERVDRMIANESGKAIVFLRSEPKSAALVDEQGNVTASVELGDLDVSHARIDAAGRLIAMRKETLEKHPGWGFPTKIGVTLDWIGTGGRREQSLAAYRGPTDGLPPDYEGGFIVSPSGTPAALGRNGGLWYRNSSGDWRLHDDLPLAQKRFEVLFPRFPVGGTMSPDGRYLFCTFDTRPPSGAFSRPALAPQSAEATLFDLETGKRIWSLRDADFAKPTFATHSGFAAVSRDGRMTALADVNGVIYLVDQSGRIVVRREVVPAPDHRTVQIGAPEGIGVWISDDGQLAAYAFNNSLVLARADGSVEQLPLSGLESACVARDGSLVTVALHGGQIVAFTATGEEKWKASLGTNHSVRLAAVGANATLVVTGEAVAIQLNAAGREQSRSEIYASAEKVRRPIEDSKTYRPIAPPSEYRDPGTLEFAKTKLGARQIAAWQPTGAPTAVFRRRFYTVDQPITLSAGRSGEGFLHLVYRRPEANKQLTVTIDGTDQGGTFDLDLPTPEYRVIDLPVGAGAKVTIAGQGSFEVAECSLWSFAWAGANLAFIKPAGVEGPGDLAGGLDKPKRPAGDDDLLAELGVKSEANTAIKKTRIWWPNSDPDQVAGPFLRAPVDPTQVVDGRRFGKKPLLPWASQSGNFQPTRGGFFTIDLGKPQPLALAATYDRATKQSEVATNIAVFTGDDPDSLTTGTVLGGVANNDQFWRLLPLAKPQAKAVGIHLFRTATSSVGLNEVEIYSAK